MLKLSPIPEAILEIKEGRMILVIDDPHRENEGDLVCAAQHATTEVINFMASEAKGLICMPMSQQWTRKLHLPQMVVDNTDNHTTAFTVSIDHIDTTTGISAVERALTARKCTEEGVRPEDFRRPGHMFPLQSKENGILEREGHTEATVDLMRLSGQKEIGLCCEIMDDDGTMMTTSRLAQFAKKYGFCMISIEDLILYRKALLKEVELCLKTN